MKGSHTITDEEDEELKPRCSMDVLSRYIPVLRWLPKYSRSDVFPDIVAGITLGLTLIPQSIAYAGLAGVDAQYGLYSTFVGAYLYIILGTTKEISLGPSALMSLLTGEIIKDMPPEFAVLLGFLAGCIELLIGVMDLGFLVDFISMPVTSGFISASALVIVVSQLQGLFGLQYSAHGFVDKVVMFFQHIREIKAGDAVMGLSCIVFLLFFKKLKEFTCCLSKDNKKVSRDNAVKKLLWVLSISRNALIVVITALIAYKMSQTGAVPFKLSGKVKPGFPPVNLPPMSSQNGDQTYTFIEMCSFLKWGIIELPLVAVLVNVAIAKAFAHGAAIDASQEMRALGICNIFGSFVSSLPTSGAFTRCMLSSASGVRTPLAGVYSGTMALLALTFLTPLFSYIPKATLSAILIAAVIFMIDWQILMPLWSYSKRDTITMVTTFVVSLAVSVQMGLLFGVCLNLAYLMYLWARPCIEVTKCKTINGYEYVLIKPDIGLFYPAIDFLRKKVLKAADTEGQGKLPLVLDCQRFKGVDYTAGMGIELLAKDFERRNQQLLLLHTSPTILNALRNLGEDTLLKSAESEADVIENLFGEKAIRSRSDAALVLERTDNEAGGIDMGNCAVQIYSEDEMSQQQEEPFLSSK